ncbi:hypothetical protein niasHT_007537 [Heterodera trifolii]|uniref:Uncharacterized protein n=1 Tax=Heterodera trifolii TaxID=157864 RepID=A0ABD2LPR9_9BILA
MDDKAANVRQKLNKMETSLMHLTTNKCQLNSSAEKARFDISRATDQHISMLRERELKLFEEVDQLLQHEQQRIEEQMEQLNQAIGTCKFVVEKMAAFADEKSLEELISVELDQKINLLAKLANSSEGANIVFSAAFPGKLCQQSVLLGQISAEFAGGPASHRFSKQTQKMDNPSVYDSWPMSQRHSSRNHSSNSICSSDDTAQAEDQPPNIGGTIRDRLASTSLSIASFDVISAGGGLNGGGGAAEHFGNSTPFTVSSHNQQQPQQQNNSFAAYFSELNCLPIDHWLRSTSVANGPKKAFPSVTPSMPVTQHPIIPNNIAEMFSKMHMDASETQKKHQLIPSTPIGCTVKNLQKPPLRKRSVADGSGDQLDERQNGTAATINWAKADLSLWLNASKNVSSPADCFAAVINSVKASAPDQWLLSKANKKPIDNSNKKVPFSSIIFDVVSETQPPEAKIARHQMQEAQFAMNKYGYQQRLDTNKNNELTTLDETEELHEALDKLSKIFETNSSVKPIEHFEQPINVFKKSFPFSSFMNDKFVDGADTAVPTIVDQHEYVPSPITVLSSPQPPLEDCVTKNTMDFLASETMKPPLVLPTDPSHWLKQYPPPKQNRPMNEMAEDLYCWESVLGWKSILEKIHGSGEDGWLAPSSRAIKNTVPTRAQCIEE